MNPGYAPLPPLKQQKTNKKNPNPATFGFSKVFFFAVLSLCAWTILGSQAFCLRVGGTLHPWISEFADTEPPILNYKLYIHILASLFTP